jgi:hypothetical protein
MSDTLTGVRTTLRCRSCHREQTAVGPSSFPVFTEVGWFVTVEEFYLPGGRHYCPEHATTGWVSWCGDDECMFDTSSDRYVTSPPFLNQAEVMNQLASYVCENGHFLIGVEPVDIESLDLPVDIEL